MTERNSDDRSVVKTLQKGLDLLDAVSQTHQPMTLSEAAEILGADTGTAHRFLNTLTKARYLEHDPHSRRYFLGAKVLQLSRRFYTQHRIYDLGRDPMMALAADCDETIQLAVLSTTPCGVLVDELAGAHPASISTPLGTQLPMHATAHGKALLAFQEETVSLRMTKKIKLMELTPNTITSPNRLEDELGRVRSLGYAQEDGEFAEGVRAIAVPIFNLHGQAVAALGIACPASRATHRQLEEYASLARPIADRISEKLGFEAAA